MSESIENPLPSTPGGIRADLPVSPTTKTEVRKARRLTKSPSLTIVALDETEVGINAQSVRDATFNLWLECKRDKQKTNKLSSSFSSQSADVIINACDVRESVYQNWLAEKEHNLIRREGRRRLELYEHQKLVEAELSMRQSKSATCYGAWCKKKDSSTRGDRTRAAREVSDREIEERARSEEKKLEASKMYEAWTEQTDKRRGAVVRKQRQGVVEKERIKQETEDTKRIEV